MSEQFVNHGANTTQPENSRKSYDVVEKEIKRMTLTAEPHKSIVDLQWQFNARHHFSLTLKLSVVH